MSSAARIKNVRKERRRKYTATAAHAARSLTLLMEDLQEEAICARIQQARKEAGLNQDQFAELLEVIKRTVQNYESNRVPWSKMGQIADITGKSTRWLLHGEEPVDAHVDTDLADIKAKLELLLSRSTAPATQEEAEETFQQELEAADELDERPEPGSGQADDESGEKDPSGQGPRR